MDGPGGIKETTDRHGQHLVIPWPSLLQIAFNGLQKIIGNLTLGCLGASEVIVEVADVCQLEP